MKKKILVLTSTYPRWKDDPEPAFVHELSRRLTSDFDIYVLCPHAPGAQIEETIDGVHIFRFRYAPSAYEQLVQNGGIMANLKWRPWTRLLVIPFLLCLLIRSIWLIRRIKPDCIHAHWLLPQGLVLAILKAVCPLPPVLLTSHGGDLFGLKGKLFIAIKKWILSLPDHITVVSSLMAEIVKGMGIFSAGVTVAPMGVDFSNKFFPDSTIFRSKNEILVVGRLVEKKGVRYLIEALPEIRQAIPDVKLTVVGYGPELGNLRSLTEHLDVIEQVDFRGAIQQALLPDFYRKCALLVAPFIKAKSGDQEGFPVALVEAVACGAPLIAGNLPVLVEAFGDKAELLLCDPKNTSMLAKKIIAALLQPADNAAAVMLLRERLRNQFDWCVVVKKYSDILDGISKNK